MIGKGYSYDDLQSPVPMAMVMKNENDSSLLTATKMASYRKKVIDMLLMASAELVGVW